MIGGYIFSAADPDLQADLHNMLDSRYKQFKVWNNGFLFCRNAFSGDRVSSVISDELVILSDDILVTGKEDYQSLDVEGEFRKNFSRRGTGAFSEIQSDFRMAAIRKAGADTTLLLASNRAGSGRIYYHTLDSGILFSSDLRFLLAVIPFQVSRMAIYALLKYGAIPEPLTIGVNVFAVPTAHCLEYNVSSGKHETRPFFRLQFGSETGPRAPGDSTALLKPVTESLQRSSRVLAEHDTAMLLSGGIDSSL